MKNVYVIRWETTRVFSSARKAAEYVKQEYSGWVTLDKNDREVAIEDMSTSKLITQINTDGFISMYDGNDCVFVSRTEVE